MSRSYLAVGLALVLACATRSEAEPEPSPEREPRAPTSEAPTLPRSRGGADLIGQPAKPWTELRWLDDRPRTLEQLRGQIVLVRFWTDTCPFCAATAPALAAIADDYAERGLVVIGIYHPKPRGRSVPVEAVATRAAALGIDFPVAIDSEWATLDAWWLDTGERDATSVSFLIDGRGDIRFIHPGPEFSPESERELFRRDHEQLRQAIEALVRER